MEKGFSVGVNSESMLVVLGTQQSALLFGGSLLTLAFKGFIFVGFIPFSAYSLGVVFAINNSTTQHLEVSHHFSSPPLPPCDTLSIPRASTNWHLKCSFLLKWFLPAEVSLTAEQLHCLWIVICDLNWRLSITLYINYVLIIWKSSCASELFNSQSKP